MTWLELLLTANAAAGAALFITERRLLKAERARRDALNRIASALTHPSTLPDAAMYPCHCGYALLAPGRALVCCGTLHEHTRCGPDMEAVL